MGAIKFGITKAPKYGKAVANWVKGKLSKTSPTIKSVPLSPNLTKRRKDFEDIVKSVDKHGKSSKASKIKHDAAKKVSGIHDRYEKASSEVKKYNRRLKQKVFGGASAAIAGTVGAHSAAKKKFPKYKKVMESDITIKDGKLGLKPRKRD